MSGPRLGPSCLFGPAGYSSLTPLGVGSERFPVICGRWIDSWEGDLHPDRNWHIGKDVWLCSLLSLFQGSSGQAVHGELTVISSFPDLITRKKNK